MSVYEGLGHGVDRGKVVNLNMFIRDYLATASILWWIKSYENRSLDTYDTHYIMSCFPQCYTLSPQDHNLYDRYLSSFPQQ